MVSSMRLSIDSMSLSIASIGYVSIVCATLAENSWRVSRMMFSSTASVSCVRLQKNSLSDLGYDCQQVWWTALHQHLPLRILPPSNFDRNPHAVGIPSRSGQNFWQILGWSSLNKVGKIFSSYSSCAWVIADDALVVDYNNYKICHSTSSTSHFSFERTHEIEPPQPLLFVQGREDSPCHLLLCCVLDA